MEGKPETNAAQNFGHQSGLSDMVENDLKMSTNKLLTSEELQCGPKGISQRMPGLAIVNLDVAFFWGSQNQGVPGAQKQCFFAQTLDQSSHMKK